VVFGSHLLQLQIHKGGVYSRPEGRNSRRLFPRQILTGAVLVPGPALGLGRCGVCRLSEGYWSSMFQSPVQFDLQSSTFCKESGKKKGGKVQG
jgi:hypothetical protein